MKFLNAAAAAFMVGSAFAVPVFERSADKCDCDNLPTVTETVTLPSCTTITSAVVTATTLPIPAPGHDDGHNGGNGGNGGECGVCDSVNDLIKVVVDVKGLVKADLQLIGT